MRMSKRYLLRNACYRAKNNAILDKHKPFLDEVKPLLDENQTWDKFSIEWDIQIIDNKIFIIKPERDLEFIKKVCLEAKFKAENNLPVQFTENFRKQNVIDIINLLLLDNVTTWANYDEVWLINLDDSNIINLRVINKNSNNIQLEVTHDMIVRSIDDNRIILDEQRKQEMIEESNKEKEDNVLEMKPIEDTKAMKQLDKFFEKKKKNSKKRNN